MTPSIRTNRLTCVKPRTKSIRRLYADRPTLARINLVTIMQDLWYLLLIVIFAVLIFGLAYGCAALGAGK